jgi:hypothetical protein
MERGKGGKRDGKMVVTRRVGAGGGGRERLRYGYLVLLIVHLAYLVENGSVRASVPAHTMAAKGTRKIGARGKC